MFWSVVATAVVLMGGGGGYAVASYAERPPWAADIAYEAGFLHGNRVRHHDLTGEQVRSLLDGGCDRARAEGRGGRKARLDPALWVAGCLDGAAGKPPRHQGLAY
ncbi:hypothetical protein [Streptomyces sp. NPDC015131]|uniref:hypothetical protein n=1 Tax=Streptomyces sp. NPDC015131 TaxID=3364941 RepID=UPI0036FAF0DA